ncbi:copper resistance protein B [Sphingomonas sabuli]|uniref:Copper resistance protein B n=1 Tax=Sphingomonas sabuli TaxID=2764186 RepID=A0A7G9L407_9SPHN|nr:copper resistance protein B [Sphingomonas sabuli]QNM83356.1 copper resistance protein B [Sphingomonas sabuli]
MTPPLKLALLAAAAAAIPATPAVAQHQGHAAQPKPAAPAQPVCLPEHAAMGHCTLAPAQKPEQPKPTAPAQPVCLPEHAAMGHCTLAPAPGPAQPKPATPAQPICLPEHAAMGHCTLAPAPAPAQPKLADPAQPACLPEHAAMGHCTLAPAGAVAGAEGTDLPAGNAPPPPVPTANAADAVYGSPAMEMGRHHLNEFHGGQKLFQVMANVAEAQIRKGRDGFEWDAEGWYGGDINRLWLKSEGEGAFGEGLEKAEVQVLYSHAVDPYFNIQGGLRYDFKPNPSRVYATIGFEGLAPSFFDVEGALFLSNKGEVMARLEGYYDQRITQRLVLQPRAELNFAAQSSRQIGVGSGLSDAEIGVRLRYDIRREFAPYLGIQYRRAFGRTRDYLRDAGEDAGGWSFLAGVRTWF